MTGTSDPVGLTLASIGTGSTAGAAIITTGMIVFRSLPQSGDPAQATDLGFLVITASLLSGIGTAAVVGWLLTIPLGNLWRRAVVGALSVFGTVLLAALTMPADMLGGRPALFIYLAALTTVATYTRRAARRATNA